MKLCQRLMSNGGAEANRPTNCSALYLFQLSWDRVRVEVEAILRLANARHTVMRTAKTPAKYTK
jgi:hypothetical protein